MQEIPLNRDLLVTVKTPRNPKQFRLAWALADIVSRSCDWLQDREVAMAWIKIRARHVNMISEPLTGKVAIVPRSIAFASLDQAGFKRVLDRMIYVVTTEIIPGMEEGALQRELESMVGADMPKTPIKRKKSDAQSNPAEAAEGRSS